MNRVSAAMIAAFATISLISTLSPRCIDAQETNDPAGLSVAQRQQQVAQNYERLEELLIRLADVEASTHPERAALLKRAARQSREMFVLKQLNNATKALGQKQFQLAIDNQTSAKTSLDALLKLLLSEDRQERIREEKDRIKRIKKDIERRLRQQKATRARTENGVEADELKDEQRQIAEKTKELGDELRDDDSAESDQSDSKIQEESDSASPSKDGNSAKESGSEEQGKDGESKPRGEGKEKSGSDSKQKPGAGEPKEGKESQSEEGSESESQPKEAGSPQDSPQSQSPQQQQESQPSQDSSKSDARDKPLSPQQSAAERLDQAEKKMRQAEKQLEDAKREEAVEKQEEAEQLLRRAIEDLDRILRQLREEEKERELARLESRFQKMAEMQSQVYEKTKELDEIPEEIRDRSVDIRSGNLAFEEKKIILEADRALMVLREEGSSVAFPEVVEQMRSDMQSVSDRLSETKVGIVTQGLQEDVLAAIEEMIEALQQAQRDLEQKKSGQQPQMPQQGQPGESPLVQPIAELKLIRTLETRIKKTTERYSRLASKDGTSLPEDVQGLINDLSHRQLKIYKVTRDIVLKKNR